MTTNLASILASEPSSYVIQPGVSADSIKRRRRLAEALMMQGMDSSPVQHWTQGAARVAQAMLGGYDLHKADQEEKAREKATADALGQLPGLGTSIPSNSMPIVPQSAPSMGAMASAPGKIYSNDEPSPLDPPSGSERDLMARTIVAEAGNQPQTGIDAVANVIRNRAVSGNFGGDTPTGVVTARNQFEPHNTQAGRMRMAAIDPNSPAYRKANQAIDSAYVGANDPTGGATHFYAPKAQAALGRSAPAWDDGTGQDIGDHRFFRNPGQPTEMSAQARAPMQVAPQAPAQQPAQPGGLQIDPQTAAHIRTLIANPNTRAYGMQLYNTFIAKQATNKPTYGVIGEDEFGRKQYGWIDPVARTTTPGGQMAQTPAAAPAQQPALNIPPPPPGADPKKWRETFTKEAAERAAVQPKREAQQKQIANVVVQDIDRAINTIDTATLPTTGAAGAMLSNIGGTAARDVRALMDTIRANAGFAELQKMRDNSPTGGALGQVSEREIAYLQATIGNLEQSQSAEQLKDNLRRVKNAYLDIIHGPGNGPRETLSFEQQQQGGPQVGHIEDGYRFKGGNPADPNSWERAQ